MKVDAILQAKGRGVETIQPTATLAMVIHEFSTKAIGALVVSSDGESIEGVISERDVVRGLSIHGPELLGLRVGDLMARSGPTCSPEDTLKHVMAEMTHTRQRHIPVVKDGKLCGIVSIGDVVKNRLEELELETAVLRDAYIAHTRYPS